MSNIRIYLDCADIAKIKGAFSTDLVDGIATNPNKIAERRKTDVEILDEVQAGENWNGKNCI